jgi:hypothetical protein
MRKIRSSLFFFFSLLLFGGCSITNLHSYPPPWGNPRMSGYRTNTIALEDSCILNARVFFEDRSKWILWTHANAVVVSENNDTLFSDLVSSDGLNLTLPKGKYFLQFDSPDCRGCQVAWLSLQENTYYNIDFVFTKGRGVEKYSVK